MTILSRKLLPAHWLQDQDDNSHDGTPITHDIYSLIVIQWHHHNYDGYYDDCYNHDLYYSFTQIYSGNYSALCIQMKDHNEYDG